MKRITLISATLFLAACNNTSNDQQATADSSVSTVADSAITTTAPVANVKEAGYKNIHFTVRWNGNDSDNSFTLTPSGYSISNDSFVQKAEGGVVALLADDIDGDDNPEVAVITAYGKDSVRKAYVFSSNSNKSMSAVHFGISMRDRMALVGYSGHDEYNFVENSFIRRFPLYANGAPTGKWRQIQFRLKPGEAMKQLVQYKVVEY